MTKPESNSYCGESAKGKPIRRMELRGEVNLGVEGRRGKRKKKR